MLKATSKTILFFSTVGLVLGLLVGNSCELSNSVCASDFLVTAGIAVAIFSLLLIVINVIFLFLEEKVFHSWIKFARIYLIIVFILVILAPATGEYGMGFSLGIDQESTTWTTAILFLLISLIIIIHKSIQLRRSKQSNPPFPTAQPK